MGETVSITSHPRYQQHAEPTLSKRQLATELGCTVRWVEMLQRQPGFPSALDERGRRRYQLARVRAFLANEDRGGAA